MAIAVIILPRITEFLLQVQPIEALSQVKKWRSHFLTPEERTARVAGGTLF
ncbi:hypothetical protein [Pseudanabaena sp. UWO310]|uniref:hypothetical protein n=1 Tax=Pseudanabaena sp. UWO310 TaxID=2480795 RepID=UPI0016805FCF|nr:hypothetical protein [Pseudanabaena sp. UWO310]